MNNLCLQQLQYIYNYIIMQAMQEDSHSKAPLLEDISEEVKQLSVNCGPEERHILVSRHQGLEQSYGQIEQLLVHRDSLCNTWTDYSAVQSSTKGIISAAQQILESQQPSPEDLSVTQQNLADMKESVDEWSSKKKELEQLMSDARMTIKDKANQRTLRFHTEIQSMKSLYERTNAVLEQKQGKVAELSTLWEQFEARTQILETVLTSAKQSVESSKVNKPELASVEQLLVQTQTVESNLESCNDDYDVFRELGRKICVADAVKAATAQDKMTELENQWETIHSLIHERARQTTTVTSLWQQYDKCKMSVMGVLQQVQEVAHTEPELDSQQDIKEALDRCKVCA